MAHSGNNGGKKWQLVLKEKFGCVEATIFDSNEVGTKLFQEKWFRPQRTVDLFEDFLKNHQTFNYESHGLKVLGNTFNRPLFFKNKEQIEE